MAEPTGKEKDKPEAAPAGAASPATEEGHYEEVAEYRIGEGPPPLGLIVAFALIVIWATVSWIPFFGY
ncbi:MAG TPA: hypothetical protein V6D08_02475 [Candidatus Obscuribacterales bacterium]